MLKATGLKSIELIYAILTHVNNHVTKSVVQPRFISSENLDFTLWKPVDLLSPRLRTGRYLADEGERWVTLVKRDDLTV